MPNRGVCYRFIGLLGYTREQAIHIFHANLEPNKKALCELDGIGRMDFLANLTRKEVTRSVKKSLELEDQPR